VVLPLEDAHGSPVEQDGDPVTDLAEGEDGWAVAGQLGPVDGKPGVGVQLVQHRQRLRLAP
jgi:hypothetical protein